MDLIETMEKKWSSRDFIDFRLFISNIDSLKSGFDPIPYDEDSELYFIDIMKIGDGLRKKQLKRQKRQKNYQTVKPICW